MSNRVISRDILWQENAFKNAPWIPWPEEPPVPQQPASQPMQPFTDDDILDFRGDDTSSSCSSSTPSSSSSTTCLLLVSCTTSLHLPVIQALPLLVSNAPPIVTVQRFPEMST